MLEFGDGESPMTAFWATPPSPDLVKAALNDFARTETVGEMAPVISILTAPLAAQVSATAAAVVATVNPMDGDEVEGYAVSTVLDADGRPMIQIVINLAQIAEGFSAALPAQGRGRRAS